MGRHADLTADLLAVIDADLAKTYRDRGRRRRMYLGLRTIVKLHYRTPADVCAECGTGGDGWPCWTVEAVAGALGVDGDGDCRPPASTESDEQPSDGCRDHPHGLETGETA